MVKMDINSFLRRKGKKWIILYSIFCVNFAIFLIYVLLLEPYWGDINFTVSGWVDFKINIVLIIGIIIIIPLIYGLSLLIIKLRKLIKTNRIKPHIIHKILPIILLIIYNLLIMVLLDLLEEYANVIFQSIEFYSFFIFLGLDIVLIMLLYPLLKIIPQLKENLSNKFIKADRKRIIILTCILGGYIITYAIPFILIPSNVLYYDLPPKPELIAHRGASHLAPENTIEAGEAALLYDLVVGWEVDIQISYDGVPFLMHDDTLTRTTNISEHFPNRKDDKAYTFNISELRELDAGSWFVDDDPFGVIASGIISKASAEAFRGIKIPTFDEVLNFTRDNGYLLDFDADRPPEGHPYRDDFYEILLNMTIESGMDLSKVMIATGNSEWIEMINNTAPEIQLGWWGSPSVQEFQSSTTNYTYINTGDGYSNEEYRVLKTANVDTMVWTIESVERFYQLWCLGVDWVKTNSPYKFNDLESNFLFFPIFPYITIWIALCIVALSSINIIRHKLIKKQIKMLNNKD
jgi:glycerophosphoinositol inositolphosphodiesterase